MITPEMRAEYNAYIRSPAWRRKRQRRLSEAHGACQRCGCTNKRLDLHHLTYERLGDELDEDLILVCSECHEFEDRYRAIKSRERSRAAFAAACQESEDQARDTYMRKKYGSDWEFNHGESDEFDRWIARKRGEDYYE